MNTQFANCPECGEETIEMLVGTDTEGGGGYLNRSFTYADINKRDCDCELTDEQEETLCDEAAESYNNGDDYPEYD